MPNRENIQKWVDALRSGDYKQTIGALENEYGNCCLGVACRVAIGDGLRVNVYSGRVTSFDGEDAHLPASVRDWLGVDRVVLGGWPATYANDWAPGWDFARIADEIERAYLSPSTG